MSKKGKIIFGVITIIWVAIAAVIGMGYLPNEANYKVFLSFILMSTPVLTILCVINLLRKPH